MNAEHTSATKDTTQCLEDRVPARIAANEHPSGTARYTAAALKVNISDWYGCSAIKETTMKLPAEPCTLHSRQTISPAATRVNVSSTIDRGSDLAGDAPSARSARCKKYVSSLPWAASLSKGYGLSSTTCAKSSMEYPGDRACQRATNDNRRTDSPTRASVWLSHQKRGLESSDEERALAVIWFR